MITLNIVFLTSRNCNMISGSDIILDAKITGITPEVFTFSGMKLEFPPSIFLPTTFFEYCTGILLVAS